METTPSLTFYAPSGRTPWVLNPETNKTRWSIGRSKDCDICLDQGWVSGRRPHAYVRFNENDRTWEIQDNDSTNGVWLNNVRAKSMAWSAIVDNDELKFGNPSVPAWSALHFFLAYDDDTLNAISPDEPTVGWSIASDSSYQQEDDAPNTPDNAIALIMWVLMALWDSPMDSPSPEFLLVWRVIVVLGFVMALYEFGPLIIDGMFD